MNLGYVYVVQSFNGGPIKIGYSVDPERRLATLQCGHPELLDLLGSIELPRAAEQVFHDELAAWRIGGEWFEDSEQVCRVLETFIAPKLDDPIWIDLMRCIRVVREELVKA